MKEWFATILILIPSTLYVGLHAHQLAGFDVITTIYDVFGIRLQLDYRISLIASVTSLIVFFWLEKKSQPAVKNLG